MERETGYYWLYVEGTNVGPVVGFYRSTNKKWWFIGMNRESEDADGIIYVEPLLSYRVGPRVAPPSLIDGMLKQLSEFTSI